MTHRGRAVLALATGGVLALSVPPLRWWPSVFVGLALLAIVTRGVSTLRGALYGWLVGAVTTLGVFYWIVGTVTRFTVLPWPAAVGAYVLLAAVGGLALGATGAIAAGLSPVVGQPIALALGILVTERYAPAIFPWQIASPLVFAGAIPQCGDLFGVSGLGALLAGLIAVIVDAPRNRRRVIAAVCVLGALWIYGAVRARMVERATERAPVVRVALLQPAIPAAQRWEDMAHPRILQDLQEQTHGAMAAHVALVVWSEAAFPYQLPNAAGIDGMSGETVYPWPADAPIIVGAITYDESDHRYNAAFVRDVDGTLSPPVDKRILVPFGEYVPVVAGIPWLRRAFLRADGLTPGTQPTRLVTESGLSLGILNCFEDTFDRLGADLAGVDLLVNMTNDAWFGTGPAPWQHLMLAQWRAIEERRELLRAVNTGVTCRVDARGQIRESISPGNRGTLVVDARRLSLRSLAPIVIRYGPPLALVIVVVGVLERLRRRYRSRGRTD